MATRIITGLILAAAVLGLALVGPPALVWAAILVAAAICAHELYTMAMPGRRVEAFVGSVVCSALLVPTALAQAGVVLPVQATYAIWSLGLLAPGIVILARPHPIEDAARRMLTLWGGFVYIGGAWWFALVLAQNPRNLLLAFAIVFAGDTGAYFAGRALGKNKLYPLLSPKKTREGSMGGLAASVLGAFIAKWTGLTPNLSPEMAVGLGLAGGALGQAGDLVESAVKRACGVKDSGNILPGHGGLLDRVDGFIFAAPVFAIALAF